MTALDILNQQIADEITGQQALMVRFQHQMPGKAFNTPDSKWIKAEYIGLRLQNNRLHCSSGRAGRELTEAEVSDLFAMIPEFEDEFWAGYAAEMRTHEVMTNTDPRIICWPAEALVGGKSIDQQMAEFFERFM